MTLIFKILVFAIIVGVCTCATTSTTTPKTKAASTTSKSQSSAPAAPKSQPAVSPGDTRLKSPWVAAIFQRNAQNKNEWDYLCSGTITGRYTILTSARCLLPRVLGPKLSSRPHHIKYSDLQVAVGLPTTLLSSKDQYTQIGTVGQIRDVYDANTSGDTPEGDLASIRLKNVLNLDTPFVKSVQLIDKAGTLMEVNETKSGEVLLLAGYEKSGVGVATRSQDKGNPLKLQEVIMEDVGACIDKYTKSYQTFYFHALCGKLMKKGEVIPCHMEGAGLVKQVVDGTGTEANYLFGVYSSNTASAKSEGTLVAKNRLPQSPCTASDTIFFARYGHLGKWASSNNFCDHDLAMCSNNKCRPWGDLCNAQVECDDGSDETEKVCGNQDKDCGGSKDKFRCKYGACIDKKLTCDGVRDCKDSSDEDMNGICKGQNTAASAAVTKTSGNVTFGTCEGIKAQQSVTAHCSHADRKGLIPCDGPVPIGTQAVLRSKEITVNCQRHGKWSRSTRLTC